MGGELKRRQFPRGWGLAFRGVFPWAPGNISELLKTNSCAVEQAVSYFRHSFIYGRLNVFFASYSIVYAMQLSLLRVLSDYPLIIYWERTLQGKIEIIRHFINMNEKSFFSLFNHRIIISLGLGSAVVEKVKKRGQIGKTSASGARPAVVWRGGKGCAALCLPRLPLRSLR